MNPLAIVLALAEVVPAIASFMKKGDNITEKVAQLAVKITGKDEPKQIVDCLKTQPSLLLEFYKMILEVEKDMHDAVLQDRASARQFARIDHLRVHMMLGIAVLGLIVCLGLLYHGHCSAETVGILSTVCGIFGSCLKDVYAFQFGTTWRHENEPKKSMF